MGYNGIAFETCITINKIYSVHYFEYMSDFTFDGETHDFWEFVCVDKGEVLAAAENKTIHLKRGDIIFHQPNEFHNIHTTGNIAPNLIVISFQCRDEAMSFFCKKVLKIDETERNILANIIIEARQCYDCRLDDPYLQNMPCKEPQMFGAGQMICIYLEHLLIHLFRRYFNSLALPKEIENNDILKSNKSKSDAEIFDRITDYLTAHLNTSLTIEQICKDNLIGRSQLQKLFKYRRGLGVIEYFSLLKINAAKEMIRTNNLNFTQISEQLGFSSIHYFSRKFKQITGMTPSEYALSIKALAEGQF